MTLTQKNYTTTAENAREKPRKTRIACYERVSTEEQALHGYSISAQKESLIAYCKQHGYVIIGHYTDEGVSGGKPADKRPAMSRLLWDIRHDMIDMVLFCKLDRWFRNVPEYFKTQEVLEQHNVSWNAIQEEYETATAAGRMTVTIMLSVAQNERERTAERIKSVFDYRAAKGEFLTGGHAVPYGYRVVDKHLEKDPQTAPAIERLFALILGGDSINHATQVVRIEHPDGLSSSRLRRLIYNPHYAGIHNGIPGYCPQYITEAEHYALLSRKGTRSPKNQDSVFLFSGILTCPVCGRKMSISHHTDCGKMYVYYFCAGYHREHDCTYAKRLAETRLECVLSDSILTHDKIVVDEVKPLKTAQKTANNAHAIEQRMKRLAETYTDGLIDHETYKRKLSDLTDQLQTARNAPRNDSDVPVGLIKEILEGDITDVYNRLKQAEKKQFWQLVLISAKINEDYSIHSLVFNDAPVTN